MRRILTLDFYNSMSKLFLCLFLFVALSCNNSDNSIGYEKIPYEEYKEVSLEEISEAIKQSGTYTVILEENVQQLYSSIDKVVLRDSIYYISDWKSRKIISFSQKKALFESINNFSSINSTEEKSVFASLFSVMPCNDKYIVSGLWNSNIWYRDMDSAGHYGIGVPHISFDNLSEYGNLEIGSLHLGLTMSIKPDNSRVITALRKAGAISLSSVVDGQ